MSTPPNPSRGEVWDICFDPSVGAEIQKTRPAVVVNIASVGRPPCAKTALQHFGGLMASRI